MRRRLALGVLTLIVASAGATQATTLYRCRYTAVVRTTCCCAGSDVPTVPTLRRNCCDVQRVDAVRMVSEAPRTPVALDPFAAVPALDAPPIGPRPPRALARTLAQRGRIGPTLRLLKQSFLI